VTKEPDKPACFSGPSPLISALLLLNTLTVLLATLWLRWHGLENLPGLNGDEAWYGVKAWEIAHGVPTDWHTPTGNPLNPLFLGGLC
jgi:hypothetical protein